MQDPTVSLKPTSARERRNRKKPFTVKISDNLTVTIRPVDMLDAFFNDLIPMPMLNTFGEMEKMAKQAEGALEDLAMGDVGSADRIIKETRQSGMVDFLRRYALAAVIDPILTPEDDGNEDHLPVTDLTYLELMGIYDASPQEEAVKAPEALTEFRGSEQGPVDPDVSAGQDVRPETELVDHGVQRETITA